MKLIFLSLIFLSSAFGDKLLQSVETKVSEVSDNKAKISIGDLIIGQSGVIIDKNSMIIAIASVIKSDTKDSEIKFYKTTILKQDAVPRSNLDVANGDKLILNHLYGTSLAIVPNYESKKLLEKLYPNQIFLSEDFFASHLKLNDTPIPTQDDIQEFCNNQQIGTLFFVINQKLYIVDVITFKVLKVQNLNQNLKQDKIKVPFYSKIEEIKKGFWDFGDDNITDYNKYYRKMIGKNDDK